MFYTSYKKIIKNKILFSSGIYLIFSLLNQMINIFYTPLLTRTLSQKDYGIYNLLLSIEGLLSLFLLLCVPTGYTRFYNEAENKNKLENSFLNLLILVGVMGLIIISFFSKDLNQIFLKNMINGKKYIILIGFSSYILGLISLLTIKYSMEFKALKVSIINFSCIFFQFAFIVILFKINRLNIINILYIKCLIPFIILSIIFSKNIKYYKFEIDKKLIKTPLKFSLGLVLGQASTWILALIDRQFISGYCGFNDVGIYSLGCKIGMLINPLFIEPLKKIYTPLKFKIYNLNGGKEIIIKYYKFYCFIGGLLILILSIYAKIAITILATKEYMLAIYIIPIIALSYFLWGLNEFYALGLVLGNKSIINSGIAFSAAIINIIFNILLIPKLGMFGAAVSTIVSYFLTNELYYYFSKKNYSIELKKWEWIKFIFISGVIYGMKLILDRYINLNIFFEGIINMLYLVTYFIVNILLKNITLKELKEIYNNGVI